MFTFVPLVGESATPSRTLASQSLLTFDSNVRVLIDVGWDDQMTESMLSELERLTPTIDLILLTHATFSHIGAYAYACKRFPGFDSIPVYATLPVINMGRMATIDAYTTAWFTTSPASEASSTAAAAAAADVAPSAVDTTIRVSDIDAIFDKIQSLKYSQQLSLSAKLSSLRITAHNAGHSLGGTLWRLQYGQEDVVYAVDWNHAVERHLNSSALLTAPDQLGRPTALICGARTGLAIKGREEMLISAILRSLDRGGDVILPTSTSARALELCLLLDAVWSERRLREPLLFVSRVGSRTLAYARSMLEWMSPAMVREWEDKGSSPFTFKYLRVVATEEEARAVRGPKVVLASGQGLEWGVSRSAFADICEDERSMTIFTQGVDQTSFGGEVLAAWNASAAAEGKMAEHGDEAATDARGGPVYTRIQLRRELEIRKSVPLQGEELERYISQEKARKALADRQSAIELKNRTILDQEAFDESESSESESEDEVEIDEDEEAAADAATDIGVLVLSQDNRVYDYDVRHAKGLKNKMFPYIPKRVRRDPYGEVIKIEDYVRAEERDDVRMEDANGGEDGGKGGLGKIGMKRKWTQERAEEEERTVVIPSKTVSERRVVNVRCEVTYIEYEGLADARSFQMIIPQVQPRKLIFISGSLEQADGLAVAMRNAGIQDIYVPASGKPLNLSMDANAYMVTLSWDLARQLKWQSTAAGEYTVAQVRSKVAITTNAIATPAVEESEAAMEEDGEGEEKEKEGGDEPPSSSTTEIILNALTTKQELAEAAAQSKSAFVGDVRLAELRRKLVSEGLHAEFRGEGVLLCERKIAVRKLANDKVIIEGSVSKEFYRIRRIVDSFMARVV
ncbi:beta-lactamase-like protein [Myxozyma melibiosi]|uniref:Cleavage and polyadenylation specificity factor subunit 2 n=1 Tax=Myxozyma melibiosi TaxID=54550 RepID=A0ABR1FFT6_9ASCO